MLCGDILYGIPQFEKRITKGYLVSAGVHDYAAQTLARPSPPRPELNPAACRHHDRRHLTFIGTSVVDSTGACGGRLGGGPAHDSGLHPPRLRSRTGRGHAVTPHSVTRIYPTRNRRALSTSDERARHASTVVPPLIGSPLSLETGSEFRFSRTLDEDDAFPGRNDRESLENEDC
jgi:hypothetical protein